MFRSLALRSALVVSLAMLLGGAATGCAPDAAPDADEVDDVDDSEDALAPEYLEVVQFNPFYGGQYPQFAYNDPDWQKLPKTYATMNSFAQKLAAEHPNASVIGMQEITSAANAEQIRIRLGAAWRVAVFEGSVSHPGETDSFTREAIFWRDDKVGLIQSFGTREVRKYKSGSGKTVSNRFGGALLANKATGKSFGYFTGKLTPRHMKALDGHTLSDDERANEVATLKKWVTEKMKGHESSVRIVAVDMNSDYGWAPWKEFDQGYSDAHAKEETWKNASDGDWRRYDYIWWDKNTGTEKSGGFVGTPDLITKTGSDHRAVVARVLIGK